MRLELSFQARRDFCFVLLAGSLYMCSVAFTLLLPRYLDHVGATPQEIGWLIGLPVPFYVVFTLFTGWLADRLSVRWLGLVGIVLSVGASWALALQDTVSTWVWALRSIQGVGHALALTPIVTMASRLLDARSRAQGMGYFAICMQLGNIVGTLIAAVLIERVGFSAYFHVALVLGAASAIVYCRVSPAAAVPLGSVMPVVGEGGTSARIVHGLVLMLVIGGAFGMVLQYSPLLLDHLVATEQVPVPFSASWILTAMLASVIAVRLLAPQSIYRPGGEPWLMLCMAGLPAALLLFPAINGLFGAVLVAGLLGGCYGVLLPMVHALCLNRAGSSRQGWVVGLTNLTYESGYRGFGFLMGPVVAVFGYGGVFATLALLTSAGVAIFLMLERMPGRWLDNPD